VVLGLIVLKTEQVDFPGSRYKGMLAMQGHERGFPSLILLKIFQTLTQNFYPGQFPFLFLVWNVKIATQTLDAKALCGKAY